MLRAPALVFFFLLTTAAEAVWAGDGAKGPNRWLLASHDELLHDEALTQPPPTAAAASDPLSKLFEHWKHDPVGWRSFFTLVPPAADDERKGTLPTIAFFARAQGRTIISLTHVNARADSGQEVVMQRTVVSDLLAGRRFSLMVYEDHAIGDAAARLMGVGTKLTFRPEGWPFRVEVLGAYDMQAGASAFLAITSVFAAPPLPPAIRK